MTGPQPDLERHQMWLNDFLKTKVNGSGSGGYPKTRTDCLKLLQSYSSAAPVKQQVISQGASFAQKGGGKFNRGGKGGSSRTGDYDREHWKDKECHGCHKKGHPQWACPNNNRKDKDDDDDDTSEKPRATKRIKQSTTKPTKAEA